MSLVSLVNFQEISDPSGTLTVYERGRGVSFDVQRVYCLSKLTPSASRGYHAHKNLKQIAICVSGSCRFVLDDGERREEVILQSPSVGLYIENLIWREMHDFSDDCVLMVMASALYTESDYLRTYEEFIDEVSRTRKN
jgi:dTDP-4-dehydrorhamnose 3,5-epimerase-like enzyme